MTIYRRTAVALLVTITALVSGASALAAPPAKLVLSDHFGVGGGEPAAFEHPEGVAGAPGGDIYVADRGNNRVQELTSSGAFVLMFGKEVNTATNGDICTAQEVQAAVRCGAGRESGIPGAMAEPRSVAVDPVSNNVAVEDFANWRVDEYTAAGQLVLMIGRQVNQTVTEAVETKGGTPTAKEVEEENLCTVASKDTCKAGSPTAIDSNEKGAFDFEQGPGNLLAFGGSEDYLYVGDAHRMQEFNGVGEWRGEIVLPTEIVAQAPEHRITAIAVSGEIAYVVYNHGNTIYEFNADTGVTVGNVVVPMREPQGVIGVRAMALDSRGHLAVAGTESVVNRSSRFGLLFDAATGVPLTSFTLEENIQFFQGLGFNGNDELYLPGSESDSILHYIEDSVGEAVTGGTTCQQSGKSGSSIAFTCTLKGEINPYGVAETETRFEWGLTCALGNSTSFVSTPLIEGKVSEIFQLATATISGIRPNESGLCDRLAAVDQIVKLPETLTGKDVLFKTPAILPEVISTPSPTAAFVTPYSVVMRGELNPENSSTEYDFEYAAETKTGQNPLAECESPRPAQTECPGVFNTKTLEAETYGQIGATLQAGNLQPSTRYYFRLAARNEVGEGSASAESSVVTEALPAVTPEEEEAELQQLQLLEEEWLLAEQRAQAPYIFAPGSAALLQVPGIVFPRPPLPPGCKHGTVRKRGVCTKKKSTSRKTSRKKTSRKK